MGSFEKSRWSSGRGILWRKTWRISSTRCRLTSVEFTTFRNTKTVVRRRARLMSRKMPRCTCHSWLLKLRLDLNLILRPPPPTETTEPAETSEKPTPCTQLPAWCSNVALLNHLRPTPDEKPAAESLSTAANAGDASQFSPQFSLI